MLGTFCFFDDSFVCSENLIFKINPSIYFSNAINSISRNSWNVINYCDELLAAPSTSPKNYWANTSGNGLILRLLDYELVENWFQEVTRSNTERINRFCMAFPAGDAETIQEMLGNYLWDSISVRDTAVRRNMKENFYHGMLLGLLRSQGSWLVKSNAETGEGYSDISIQTPDRVGIVIELKYADDGNLEAAGWEALRQIEEKKYAEGLKRWGTKKILKYGIAFYEKECMVVMA